MNADMPLSLFTHTGRESCRLASIVLKHIASAQKCRRHRTVYKMINNGLFPLANSAKHSKELGLCHILNTLIQGDDCFMHYSWPTLPSNLASKNATSLPRTCNATVATVLEVHYIGDPKKAPKFMTCTVYVGAGSWQFNFCLLSTSNSPVHFLIIRLISGAISLHHKSNCTNLFCYTNRIMSKIGQDSYQVLWL
jgi:hypothetical protein